MNRLQLSIIAVLLMTFGLIMVNVGKQEQIASVQQAYQTCLKAHGEINRASEQACGDAQDRTHTEFVCSPIVVPYRQHCWLEVK